MVGEGEGLALLNKFSMPAVIEFFLGVAVKIVVIILEFQENEVKI